RRRIIERNAIDQYQRLLVARAANKVTDVGARASKVSIHLQTGYSIEYVAERFSRVAFKVICSKFINRLSGFLHGYVEPCAGGHNFFKVRRAEGILGMRHSCPQGCQKEGKCFCSHSI